MPASIIRGITICQIKSRLIQITVVSVPFSCFVSKDGVNIDLLFSIICILHIQNLLPSDSFLTPQSHPQHVLPRL